MAKKTLVTLSKGGTKERTVPVSEIEIPDMWHISQAVRRTQEIALSQKAADLILEVWHLAHDLKKHIEESPSK